MMKLRKPNVITAQYVIEKQKTRSNAGKQYATSFPEKQTSTQRKAVQPRDNTKEIHHV